MNACGECTACCTLLPIKWLDKPAGTDCVHCDGGCLIHDTKHFECSSFECSWLQSGVDNPALRPDRCGVIFEKVNDTTFFGTISAAGKANNVARRQVENFISQGYTVELAEAV